MERYEIFVSDIDSADSTCRWKYYVVDIVGRRIVGRSESMAAAENMKDQKNGVSPTSPRI